MKRIRAIMQMTCKRASPGWDVFVRWALSVETAGVKDVSISEAPPLADTDIELLPNRKKAFDLKAANSTEIVSVPTDTVPDVEADDGNSTAAPSMVAELSVVPFVPPTSYPPVETATGTNLHAFSAVFEDTFFGGLGSGFTATMR